jgi:hypothetical protein
MNANRLRRPIIAGLLACLVASLTLSGQTTSSPYEPELNSIVMESRVDLANLKTPAALPAALTGLVATGAVELRSRVDNYDPVARTVRTTLFLAIPSKPLPLAAEDVPAATDATMVSQSVLRVESIYHVKGASLAIGMAGRFVNFLGGQLPIPVGTPFLFSFTYPSTAVSSTGEPNATFGELSFLIPGTLNLYSPAPVGSITVTPVPSN